MLPYKVLGNFISFINSSEVELPLDITYSPRFYIAREKVNRTDLLHINGNN